MSSDNDFQLALDWFSDHGFDEGEDFIIDEDDGLYVYGDGCSAGAVLIKDGVVISGATGDEDGGGSSGNCYMDLTGCEGLADGKEEELEDPDGDMIRTFLENK